MPYDYAELKNYDVNFEELRNELKSKKFNFNYFEEWLEEWMKVFKNAEKDTQLQISNMLKKGIPAFETFQQPLHFGKVTLMLNFIINGADYYVNKKQLNKKLLNYKSFNNKIKWTDEQEKSRHELTKPIYLVAFPMDDFELLVIDGNHRVTELLSNKSEMIEGYYIDPINIISNNILLFTIEKAIYAFLIEVNTLLNEIDKGEHSHKILFERSFTKNVFAELNK